MRHFISADGSACQIVNEGRGMGTVVLVHGLGLNQAMWQHQVTELANHFCVLTYDLYGHGTSAIPPQVPSLSLFAEQFAGIIKELGQSGVVVAGFSLGGMIARRIAMDYPQMVAGIAILNSPHARTEGERAAIQLRVHQAAADGPGATVEAALDRWFTASFRRENPDVMDQVRHWVMANDRAVYPAIYQVLVDGVDELVTPTPAVSCPALVLTGDEDFGNNPAMSRAIAGEIDNAELVILKGLRHMAMLEAPGVFTPYLVRFCERTIG